MQAPEQGQEPGQGLGQGLGQEQGQGSGPGSGQGIGQGLLQPQQQQPQQPQQQTNPPLSRKRTHPDNIDEDDPLMAQHQKTKITPGCTLSMGTGAVRVRLVAVKSELHSNPDNHVEQSERDAVGYDEGNQVGSYSSHADERQGPDS